MKKLFALILAVVMICTMSVSVFAATDHVVGDRGATGDYEDGAESLGSVAPTYDLNITAGVGQVQHRYAVDITYENMSFNVTAGNLVWNVNTLQYDIVADQNSTTVVGDKTYNVTVTNYSDLPVNLAVAVTDHFDTDAKQDNVDVDAYYTVDSVETLYTGEKIASAINDNEIVGSAKSATFYIAVRADDWDEVATYYATYFTTTQSTSIPIATATITISQVSN